VRKLVAATVKVRVQLSGGDVDRGRGGARCSAGRASPVRRAGLGRAAAGNPTAISTGRIRSTRDAVRARKQVSSRAVDGDYFAIKN
jgi:hypothetical protein